MNPESNIDSSWCHYDSVSITAFSPSVSVASTNVSEFADPYSPVAVVRSFVEVEVGQNSAIASPSRTLSLEDDVLALLACGRQAELPRR